MVMASRAYGVGFRSEDKPHEANARWVRSWILFRLAIIAQGIAARAALGQASSALARADDTQFNFFGQKAWEAKRDAEEEDKAHGGRSNARL
jgi:hypothetical protein